MTDRQKNKYVGMKSGKYKLALLFMLKITNMMTDQYFGATFNK